MDLILIGAYLSVILIGFALGAIGSGGSILAFPILIFLFDIPATEATSYSLFMVAVTSVYGTVRAQRRRSVRWDVVFSFGIPMLIAVVLARKYVLPGLPEEILGMDRDRFITVLFALIMLGAARAMWRNRKEEVSGRARWILIAQGVLTGLLTGLVGAGGGFIIVPVLTVGLGLPMSLAVGTSLAIISINSGLGFATDLISGFIKVKWTMLVIFTVISSFGLYLGSAVSSRLPASTLKKVFGALLVVLALFMLLRG